MAEDAVESVTTGTYSDRWRQVVVFTALMATALTAGLEFAHILEWQPKSGYSGHLYVHLQESLYVWFGTIGAAVYVIAVAAAVVLAVAGRTDVAVRRRLWTVAGLELTALATFLAVIYPVNLRLPLHDGAVPSDWAGLRTRWETGHAIGFVLFGSALVLLVGLVVRGREPTRTQPTVADRSASR